MIRVARKVVFDPRDLRICIPGKALAEKRAPIFFASRVVACLTCGNGVTDY